MSTSKPCVLYDRICVECGECDLCDLNPQKRCTNCMQCLQNEADYRAIRIDGMLTPEEALEEETPPRAKTD